LRRHVTKADRGTVPNWKRFFERWADAHYLLEALAAALFIILGTVAVMR
jgi:hypothetical protein